MGVVKKEATLLLEGNEKEPLMASTRVGGHIVVFAGDSTAEAWRGSTEAIAAYKIFWKQLIFWTAQQDYRANQLVIHLDKRRINVNADEKLTFSFRLIGKDGLDVKGVVFQPRVLDPKQQSHAVDSAPPHQNGTFKNAKEPGEHQLVVGATVKDIEIKPEHAKFLVAFDDHELQFPRTEFDTLKSLAIETGGDLHDLDKFGRYLDELEGQVRADGRHKTSHWPDWTRLPASGHVRDQAAGLWSSFALFSYLLFIALIGSEWLLRRLWGLV